MKPMRRSRLKVVLISALVVGLVATGTVVALRFIKPHDTPASNQSSQNPAPTVNQTALLCTEKLSDDVLLGQKLMIAVYSAQLNNEQPLIAQYQLGGVILMDETDESAIASLSAGMAIKPTIATDQEGGTVQRFTSEGRLPGAQDVASSMTASQAYSLYLTDSKYLRDLGLTTNFAPVVDVISRTPQALPGRMYSASPNSVSSYAGQYILAQKDAGLHPVIKHFPGLGSATGNTDDGPATTDPLSALKTRDLLPYQALASLGPDVMISNAIVPELTDGQPAVWSPDAVKLLRSYGYENAVVYSDSLTAKAIPGTLQDAALKAWQAGIDVAMIVQTKDQTPDIASYADQIIAQAKTALENNSLERSSVVESVARILARKDIDPCTIGDR